ncbi:shikimate dehydrogenase [Methylotenera sp. 1P/1]|uniref:shikimate dehydrogenase n=1 Tax=Methylotenera sp. 1P/1 TaxID=1131551 RepID=UPI00037B9812|nr:shikimate dehydrogenase [Methylotenera sp. 1P/1]
MVDKYAVIGNPIGHSKSPIIHKAFAEQTGEDISYEAILAPLDGFEATIQSLIAQGYKGANVTVPFKFEALNLVYPSNRALDEVAVNTLRFLGGEIRGDSTDGTGLIRDIQQNLGIKIAGKRVLLLGAGGAADGVLQPLLNEMPASLVIANRTVDKAQTMVKKILSKDHNAFSLTASAFDDLADAQFDIVINATSTGLTDTALPIPSSVFANGCLAYDMMYGRETPFMKQAREAGAEVADGLGMLVEQAAEAFYIWRGVRPRTQPVIQQLRSA